MKKYIIAAIMSFSLFAVANALTIELKPMVRTSGSKTVNLNYNNSYDKYRTVSKSFLFTIKSTSPVRVLCIMATLSGNKGVDTDVAIGNVDMSHPFECSISASSSSRETKLDFTYIPDYYEKTSNAKVEGCCIVFDLRTGKFVGMKYTSKAFADNFIAANKQQIKELVTEARNN